MLTFLIRQGDINYEDDLFADLQDYDYKEMLEKADNIVLGFVAATSATGVYN